mmetsp:Transcript_30490/g.61446  ORF Transcript_30490/g.61446 Transcript_30490/m.61446 type:complete len:206 (-) Transcript_30490:1766-2383(-)
MSLWIYWNESETFFNRFSFSGFLTFTFFLFPSSIIASHLSRCILRFLDLSDESICIVADSRRASFLLSLLTEFSASPQFPMAMFPSNTLLFSLQVLTFVASRGFHAFPFFGASTTWTLLPCIFFSFREFMFSETLSETLNAVGEAALSKGDESTLFSSEEEFLWAFEKLSDLLMPPNMLRCFGSSLGLDSESDDDESDPDFEFAS